MMKIIKCVMVGDGAAGKTYAAEAYRKKCFPTYLGYVPTVYDSFRLNIRDGSEEIVVYVYDSAGQEDYDRLRPLDYFGADVVMFWYNVTEECSYENIFEKWYPEIKHFCEFASFIVVGTQIDLRDDPWTLEELAQRRRRAMTPEDGLALARKINAVSYLECSSKTLVGIDKVFEEAARVGSTARANIGERRTTYGIHPVIIEMIKSSSELFNDVLERGTEENYDVRVMAVGRYGAGKTTLTSRMLKRPVNLNIYKSTNGIDVHVHSCHIELDTGTWIYEKCGVVSQMMKILRKRKKKHETEAKTSKKYGSHEFHKRCAKILQNIQDAEEVYFQYRSELKKKAYIESYGQPSDMHDKTENTNLADDQESTVDIGKSETVPKSGHKPNLIGVKDVTKTIETAKMMKPKKYNYRAKVSFYDFAGQDIFHASHPTFLSPKSIYTLVFDISKMYDKQGDKELDVKLRSVKYFGDCRGGRDLGDKECIFFWLNVIYMFAALKDCVYPHVVLVGTHVDKLPKADRSAIIYKCFKDLRREIADTPLKDILSQEEFAVDNTKKKDDSLIHLKAEILRLAKLQPQWGEKTPAKWLPLERELNCLKDDGLKILSIAELEEINEDLQVKINDKTEMEVFLQFLHASGEVIWFSEEMLRNYIVLDQVWLIDALKMIITAERFALRMPKLAERWDDFYQTGVISRSTIVDIFKECKDVALYENYEHVLLLMEKFLFIASPLILDEEKDGGSHLGETTHIGEETEVAASSTTRETINIGEETEVAVSSSTREDIDHIEARLASDSVDEQEETAFNKEQEDVTYIIPCMVHKKADLDILTASDEFGKTSFFCMVSINHFLPPAVFQKLLAICIKKWSIMEQKEQKQIFCGLCKFNIDSPRNNKLLIFLVGYAIHARIENYASKLPPPVGMCSQVREFLVQSLRSVLIGMGFSEKFRTCIQCPRFDPLENGGYFDIEHCEKKDTVTCDDCNICHGVPTEEMLDCWNEKKAEPEVEEDELAEGEKNMVEADNVDNEMPITHEHINHARLCIALVSVCADALREILLSEIPPGFHNAYDVIQTNKQLLASMRQLRQEQLNLIFPDPHGRYTGTVDQFDITILYTLIRNISSVQAPATGWGRPTGDDPRDTSLGANVERIRLCRNKVSGHSATGRLDDTSFGTYWDEIANMIMDIENSIGNKGFIAALEKIKQQVITSQEAEVLQTKVESYQSHLQGEMLYCFEALENLRDRLGKLQTDMDTKL